MTFDVAELKKSLQRDPKNSGLIRELGNYYLANGLYRQAREEYHLAALFSPRITAEILADFENTIEKNTMDIQSRLCLISFLLSQNEIDPAILELEELIDIDPKNLQAYNILGKIYIKMGRADDVMTLLEKALKMGVKDLSISEMLAWVYLEKKRFEEAIKFYEELPKNKKTQRTLAELYQIVGKLDKSAEKYYEMYSLDPEVATEVTIKLEELLAKDVTSISIRELLFQIYAKNMHPDLAVKKLSEIIKISPQKTDELIERLKDLLKNYPLNPEATLLLSELHAQKGDYSESIEEYSNLIKNKPDLIEKAIEGCKNIVRKYPDQFLAREFLIETYLSQGKYEEAVFEVRFLLKTYPETSEWIISKCRDLSKRNMELKECLGYAYLAKNEYALANIEAENLLAQNRQNISALLLLGEVFLKQKLCRKATETFLKAMNIAPFDKSIHAKYKDAKMKELELEAEQIKKRIQEDEWKISFHLDLGKNCLLRGQKEEALRELQIAAKDTQRAAAVHLILGNFYRNEGLYDQSLDAFRKSLQYCPQESVEQLKNINSIWPSPTKPRAR